MAATAPEQLDQGFWFIMSHGAFKALLWDTRDPLAAPQGLHRINGGSI